MFSFYRNFLPQAPVVDEGAPNNRHPRRLAGSGATESGVGKLIPGKIHVLVVGSAPVRVRFSGEKIDSDAVDDTRDIVYPAGAVVPWVTDRWSTYVYAEAGDGASDYEAYVIQYQS